MVIHAPIQKPRTRTNSPSPIKQSARVASLGSLPSPTGRRDGDEGARTVFVLAGRGQGVREETAWFMGIIRNVGSVMRSLLLFSRAVRRMAAVSTCIATTTAIPDPPVSRHRRHFARATPRVARSTTRRSIVRTYFLGRSALPLC